jgi:hypothetical protein
MMLVYRRAAVFERVRAAIAWLSRACRADVPGIWEQYESQNIVRAASCSLIGVPVWQQPRRVVGFVRDEGHAKGRDTLPPLRRLSSSPVLCNESACCSRIIPRPLRASSHNMQRIWGCRPSAGRSRGPCRILPNAVALLSILQLPARATRLSLILLDLLERAMVDIACFSSADRIWRQY